MDTAGHQAELNRITVVNYEQKHEAPIIHNINPTIIPGKCLDGKQRHGLEVVDVAANAGGKTHVSLKICRIFPVLYFVKLIHNERSIFSSRLL